MMKCVNLKERFGRRFKITYDPSYQAERPEFREAEAPWLMMIPCEHGDICAWGGDNLAACTRTAGPIAKRLKALPFATVAQDGSDGANVVFPVNHFEEVAAIMKPRRRRVVSDQERERLAALSRQYSPLRRKPISGNAPEGLECVAGALVDG